MSCIAELYLSDSTDVPVPGEVDPESPYLQSPSYQIPALWLALFEPADVVDAQRDDGGEAMPYLVKRRVDAIAVLRRRETRLKHSLPELKPEWFEQFESVLESSDLDYVHMDTSDIGQMAGSWEDWKQSLLDMLDPLMGVGGELPQSWVDQVVPEEASQASFSYCGCGGDDPMPWEDDA